MTSASTYSEKGQPADQGNEQPGELGINAQSELALANLPIRTPPDLDETCLWHGQTVNEGEVVVIFSQLALRQIAAHSNSNLDYEVGGAMLGRVFRSNGQAYVEVRAAIPAVTEDHGPVH